MLKLQEFKQLNEGMSRNFVEAWSAPKPLLRTFTHNFHNTRQLRLTLKFSVHSTHATLLCKSFLISVSDNCSILHPWRLHYLQQVDSKSRYCRVFDKHHTMLPVLFLCGRDAFHLLSILLLCYWLLRPLVNLRENSHLDLRMFFWKLHLCKQL